jgi:PAS domain S-box-containing protein
VDERQRAEDAARRAYAETEDLLAAVAWVLIAIDEHGIVRRWNTQAEEMFGVRAPDVLGRPFVDLGIDWDWRRILAVVSGDRLTGGAVRLDDISHHRPDGQAAVLSLTATAIRGRDGGRGGVLLLASDVTNRKALELQLAQAQKLESIGQLAAGVAHEINTPVQFIGDNARFLKGAVDDVWRVLGSCRRIRDPRAVTEAASLADEIKALEDAVDLPYLRDEMPKAIDQTLEGVQRVATIVRALKEFAHPDQKEKAAVDLNQALLSTLVVARNEIKCVADVVTELGELPMVTCLPGEMNQVFLNLITNAAHAIAETVAGTEQRGTIRVTTARDGEDILITVSDTGTGIPEAIRQRVFDPFFTTKEVGKGTGQGLAIARQVIVKRHGGTLAFETETGRGTTFFIRLPLDGTVPTT